MQKFRSMPVRAWALFLAMTAAPLPVQAQDERPAVCGNVELVRAIRIIEAACGDLSCDFERLRELDQRVKKSALLAALRHGDLQPVHIFFPMNETKLNKAFDWATTKREQLETLQYIDKPDKAVVYVIGRASTLGDRDLNVRLSRERMQSVLRYLRDDLRIRCRTIHGGWLGKEIMQLNESDAHFLNVEPTDFRRDRYILNQSVQIFVFPCKDIL